MFYEWCARFDLSIRVFTERPLLKCEAAGLLSGELICNYNNRYNYIKSSSLICS